MAADSSYNVVLAYTESTGIPGTITWAPFTNREKFEEWYTAEVAPRKPVVCEGVTEEEAIALFRLNIVHKIPWKEIMVLLAESKDATGKPDVHRVILDLVARVK